MLLKVHREESGTSSKPIRLENMVITEFNELVLFRQSILSRKEDGSVAETFTVTYNSPKNGVETTIEIPFIPKLVNSEIVDVVLHQSPTKAYKMGSEYNSWFSSCLGYEAVLVYLGSHLRPVLGNLSPVAVNRPTPSADTWLSSITKYASKLGMPKTKENNGITFADVAPYLIVTEESFQNVKMRLPSDAAIDITKFRPNIVLSGSTAAFDEDYWGELRITNHPEFRDEEQSSVEIILTQNCARCKSINIDFSTGKQGTDDAGTILKKLMKDRRVDKGTKYSPIFGRYGFLKPSSSSRMTIAVGDEVTLSKRNENRTRFGKPFTV